MCILKVYIIEIDACSVLDFLINVIWLTELAVFYMLLYTSSLSSLTRAAD